VMYLWRDGFAELLSMPKGLDVSLPSIMLNCFRELLYFPKFCAD